MSGFKLISLLVAAVAALLSAPSLACAQATGGAPQTVASPTAASSDQTYILGAGDVIEVSVLGRTDFTTRSRVGQDGSILLPYLGSVSVTGKTSSDFGATVGQSLEKGGYFAHPIVKVEIVSYASRYVIVLGSVGSPGLLPVDRPYRLSEILARVGGVKDGAADFVVLRSEKGAERHIAISALATGDIAEDPYVQPGDKIFSPAAEVFYISGQIKEPGAFAMRPDMTLRMAIARAGGLTDIGTDHGVKITRVGKKVDKADLDEKIQPGDVIVIGEKLF